MNGGVAEERPVSPTIVPAVTQILPRVHDSAPPTRYRGNELEVLSWNSANTSVESQNSALESSGKENPPPTLGRMNWARGGCASGQGKLNVAPAFNTTCNAFGLPKATTRSASALEGMRA